MSDFFSLSRAISECDKRNKMAGTRTFRHTSVVMSVYSTYRVILSRNLGAFVTAPGLSACPWQKQGQPTLDINLYQ